MTRADWRASVLRSLTIGAAAAAIVLGVGCENNRKKDDAAAASREQRRPRVAKDDVKEPPITAQTRYAAGQLAESQGNGPRAVEQYEAGLRADPKHLASLYRLGVVHAQAKQFDKAIDAWKRYVKATNGAAAAYANLGFCHELAGQLAEAEAAYEKGIARDGRSEPCRVNYGLMLARLGRTSEATIQFQFVLPPAAVQYNLASVHEQQGRREQAKAGYRKALELDPNFVDAQTRLIALADPGPSSASSASPAPMAAP